MQNLIRHSILAFFLFLFTGFKSEFEDSYVVYIFLHDSCRISQYYTPELQKLHNEYGGDQIEFVGLFPSKETQQDDIDSFAEQYEISFFLQKDEGQIITSAYGATVTPEVIVVNKSHRKVVYQGRIDNSYFRVGKKRQVVTTHELSDVLEQIVGGKEINVESAEAIGCIIQKS